MSSGVSCPHCGTDPGRIPQRRFLCKGCQHRVGVRTIDGHRLPLLFSELNLRRFDLVARYLGYDQVKAGELITLADRLRSTAEPDMEVLAWCREFARFEEMVFFAQRQKLDVVAARRERFDHRLKAWQAECSEDPEVGVVVRGIVSCCDECHRYQRTWRSFTEAIAEAGLPRATCTRVHYWGHIECSCDYVVVRRSEVDSVYPNYGPDGEIIARIPPGILEDPIEEGWQRTVPMGELEDAEVELVGGPMDGQQLTIDQPPPRVDGGHYYWSGPGVLAWYPDS